MPGFRASCVLVGLVVVAACSAGRESAPKTPPTYRPGQSLHSTMCSCRACSKLDCCGGAEEPGTGEGKRCEGYDFEAEGCGISVGSCNSRCYEEIWRVQRGQSCADKRPSICCEPVAAAD
jgi:hypothetical protein